MATSEDIEARLCAYVEGDLDPTQKAEIERHLHSHPQHRQMILDLVRTRRLVGDLPRHKAPVDLSDGLSGHLERAMLLNDFPAVGAAHDPWRTHAQRAPKLMIKAAVLLLSAGLVAVVAALLHVASRPVQMADLTQTPTPTVQPQPDFSPVTLASATTQPSIQITVPPSAPVAPIADAAPTTQPDATVLANVAAEPIVIAAVTTQPSESPDISSSTAILASMSLTPPTTLPTVFTVDIGVIPVVPTTQPAEVAVAPATQPVAEVAEPQ